MAFQQPQQRPQSSRQFPAPQPEAQVDASPAQLQLISPVEESEEWVLFSPQPPSVTDRTHTTSTDRTPRTAGLSRLSDFGSLDTAAQSGDAGVLDDDVVTQHGTENDEDDDLNSLDDGLHAFHEPSQRLDQSGPVLPTHDGLGSFQASSQSVQNQLWQFEKYNSRRAKQRRRTSVGAGHLDPLEEEGEWTEDNEKTRRIEKWRIEQSIALLEEIERETRRMRRISKANASRSRASSVATNKTPTEYFESAIAGDFPDAPQEQREPPPPEEQESFWSRFTRRIIRNLMGIDESILSVILGEELPKDAMDADDDASVKAIDVEAEVRGEMEEDDSFQGWEHRFLERIARELGILVSQLSEHPGAFSTYLRTQEPAPYAGIPIHSMGTAATVDPTIDAHPGTPGGFTSVSSPATGQNPYFAPTIPQQQARAPGNSDASLWGIEEEDEDYIPGLTDEASRLRHDKEYWERELDVKMVFDFLKQRFSSSHSPSSPLEPRTGGIRARSTNNQPGASTPITAARRQALIRQHHPLVGSSSAEASRVAQQHRREQRERDTAHALLRGQHYGIPQHMRSGSGGGRFSGSKSATRSAASVTSQTSAGGKSSKRKRSVSGVSGDSGGSKSKSKSKSRNYWDVGSQVGSASGVGVWGEA